MTDSGYVYTASNGETFDSIALRLYGDEKYAAALLAMNPKISTMLVFYGGEKLKIPYIRVARDDSGQEVSESSAPWKRE